MDDDFLFMTLLYDFYGALLTDKQKEIFEMYYLNDYSLGEISELLDISRQGVYDTLKRAESSLEFFEEKLGLVKKHQEMVKKLEKVKNCIKMIREKEKDPQILKIIEEIAHEIDELNL
ncbi:MAG TPA: putative DNA-binding protein [Clostridia bacterium]|nr:putative DNA-binding protein [Clostridia bacterium]